MKPRKSGKTRKKVAFSQKNRPFSANPDNDLYEGSPFSYFKANL